MNEQKLLTEQQISRRKTAAIWLIGVGLFVAFWGPIAGSWLWQHLPDGHRLFLFVLQVLEVLFMVWGLTLVKRLADPNAAVWVKHWIIAYVGSWVLLPGLDYLGNFFNFPEISPASVYVYWVVRGIITTALILAFAIYRLWAIDSVRESISGKEVGGHIRVLQGIIVASILFQCVSCFVSTWTNLILQETSNWSESAEFWSFINGSLFTCWQWIGIALFFVSLIAIKGLIRSKLFASNAAEMAAFDEQPKPQTPFFTASVCGAIMALVFCVGGVWLMIANWGQWTTEIFW